MKTLCFSLDVTHWNHTCQDNADFSFTKMEQSGMFRLHHSTGMQPPKPGEDNTYTLTLSYHDITSSKIDI